jgi:hypothetical protein
VCPPIQFQYDTSFLELVQVLEVRISVPQDCLHLRYQSQVWASCESGVPTTPCLSSIVK